MDRFLTLINIFLRHLLSRRSLWVIVALMAGALAVDLWVTGNRGEDIARGTGADLAGSQAAFKLQTVVDQTRRWAMAAAIVVSVLLAPDSRRNGTTGFVLCLGVGRLQLLLAQYAALAVFITAGVLVIHIGYCLPAFNLQTITVTEALGSWILLLLPALAMAAVALCLSATLSAVETCLILIGIPFGAFVAAELLRQHGYGPDWLLQTLHNIQLMFPDLRDLISWPHFGSTVSKRIYWSEVHALSAMAFWFVLGLWRYHRHDLGSRTANI